MTKILATALRFYDKNGLLPFLEKNSSGTEILLNWTWRVYKLLNV